MYAIIEDGGRQFKVGEGDIVRVDLRDVDAGGASGIEFDRVLLVADGGRVTVGTPLVEGAKVEAEILRPRVADRKLRVFKYKRRKRERRNMGHRQKFTEVRVTRIVA